MVVCVGNGVSCGVGERNVFVYQRYEATATSCLPVVSECCVSRKFGSIVVWSKFSFLDGSNVDEVLL